MKILQVSFMDPLGSNSQGLEAVIAELSYNLINMDHEVTVLYASDKDILKKTQIGITLGIKVPRIKILANKGENIIRKLIYNSKVKKYIKKNGNTFDIIHVHGDNGGNNLLKNYNSIFTLHGFGLVGKKHKNKLINLILKNFISRYELLSLRNAKIVTAVSNKVSISAKSYFSGKIKVIPNGIDVNKYYPVDKTHKTSLRSMLGMSEDCIHVLFIGTDPFIKGLDLAISSIDQLVSDDSKFKIKLDVIGIDEKNFNLKDQKLRTFVSFLGPIYGLKKVQIIQASDIFIFPSRGDAFSISVLEAMGCGIPSIVSEFAGIVEILKNFSNSIIVKENKIKDYAIAIEKLITDTNLYNKISENGKSFTKSLDWKEITKVYISLYEKIQPQKD
ncbi:MAG: glycosyltransferase family 4 protein [Cuniculiplasma sp.]